MMSEKIDSPIPAPAPAPTTADTGGFMGWVKNFLNLEGDASSTLRDTIDDYINDAPGNDPVTGQERILLSNILKLRDMSVVNVMIPRANIVAIEADATQDELLELLAEKQYSRIPVYRGTLDDVLGTIHIKDVVSTLAKKETIDLKSLVREIPIVSPAMPALNLLLTMRESKRHMALVVDEFGGIDGLVTVNDVLETIVGEIEDEHVAGDDPKITAKPDGTYIADARLSVGDFERKFGEVLSEEERTTADTLNGVVFAIAGRIPGRGEVITHSSGMVFEILDADPRRINLLKIRDVVRDAPKV